MIRPTLFLYIMAQILIGIALAFIIIIGIIFLVDFVELSRSMAGNDNVGWLDISTLTLLKAPSLIEDTLPFIVLFGSMAALNKLNKRSELIILRAAGLSAWRFLTPAIFVTFTLGLLWALLLNPLAAQSASLFDDIKSSFGNDTQSVRMETYAEMDNIWLREGGDHHRNVIYAKTADINARQLTTVTMYQFYKDEQDQTQFLSRYDAERASLVDGKNWLLENVMETSSGQQKQKFESLTSPTNLRWEDLRHAAGKQSDPAFWQLPAEIEKYKQAGFSATTHIIKFNRLLALPITLTAMLLIAASVSMKLTRLGGTLSLIVFGAITGFAVYFANNMIGAFGETGALPSLLAAWSVPIFILLVGIGRLCQIEDG